MCLCVRVCLEIKKNEVIDDLFIVDNVSIILKTIL